MKTEFTEYSKKKEGNIMTNLKSTNRTSKVVTWIMKFFTSLQKEVDILKERVTEQQKQITSLMTSKSDTTTVSELEEKQVGLYRTFKQVVNQDEINCLKEKVNALACKEVDLMNTKVDTTVSKDIEKHIKEEIQAIWDKFTELDSDFIQVVERIVSDQLQKQIKEFHENELKPVWTRFTKYDKNWDENWGTIENKLADLEKEYFIPVKHNLPNIEERTADLEQIAETQEMKINELFDLKKDEEILPQGFEIPGSCEKCFLNPTCCSVNKDNTCEHIYRELNKKILKKH